MITKVPTKEMSREDWLAKRKNSIGGSDAAVVVNMNPYTSPYTLFMEKTGRIPGFEGNLATEVGNYLEEFVAQKFQEETGKYVYKEDAFIFNDKYPWAHANVDRMLRDESAVLEIKTCDSLSMKKFKNGEYPDNYYAQVLHYLALTEKERGYLAVLIGNKDFRWFTIERDEEEIKALMDAEKKFWEYVRTDNPPPVDGTSSTTETLKALFSTSNNDCIDLGKQRIELLKYRSLCDQIKDLEQMRDEAVNKIKVFMGEAGSGKCAGFRVSWKTSSRSTFDRKRFEKENPQIDLSGYFKESTSRTFRVTET